MANCAYALTAPGIAKTLTIIFGVIFVLIPSAVGLARSEYLTTLQGCEENCPPFWAPWAAILIAVLIWLASLIVFIIFLFRDLDSNPSCKTKDIIGHAIAAILLVVAGVLCLVYSRLAFLTKECHCPPCGDDREDLYQINPFYSAGSFMIMDAFIYAATAVLIKYPFKKKEEQPE